MPDIYKIELKLYFERTNYKQDEKLPTIKMIDNYILRGKRIHTYVKSIISECYHPRIKSYTYEGDGKLTITMTREEKDGDIDKFFLWLKYQALEDVFYNAKPNSCAIYPTADKREELGMIFYNVDKIEVV